MGYKVFLVFACSLVLVTGIIHAQTCQYITAPSGLNVRQQASLQAEVVGKIPYATTVLVLTDSVAPLSILDEGKRIE
ncbi:MAG: hypothetical protein AAF206_13450, partial [Bacteroidota bacterium]